MSFSGSVSDGTGRKGHKSITDFVEVKHLDGYSSPSGPALEVVAACPECGAPVYGRKTLLATDVPEVRHSCDCRVRASFPDTVVTK